MGIQLNLGSLFFDVRVRTRPLEQAEDKIKKVGNEAKKTKKDVNRLGKGFDGLAKSAQIVEGPLSGISSRITALKGAFLTTNPLLVAAGLAFGALSFGVLKSAQASISAERDFLILEGRLRTINKGIGFTAEGLESLAQALGRDTLASTQEARKAIIALSNSTDITGDRFEKTLKAAQSLSDLGFGSLTTNAQTLGKILQNPAESLTRLRRFGISLTETQKEQIETFVSLGDTVSAQNIILEEFNKTLGDTSKFAAGGVSGSLDSLGESFKGLAEQIGLSITNSDLFKSAIASLTGFVDNLTSRVKESDNSTDKLINTYVAINPVVSGLISLYEILTGKTSEVIKANNKLSSSFVLTGKQFQELGKLTDTLGQSYVDNILNKSKSVEEAFERLRKEALAKTNEEQQRLIRANEALGESLIQLGKDFPETSTKVQKLTEELKKLEAIELAAAKLTIPLSFEQEQEIARVRQKILDEITNVKESERAKAQAKINKELNELFTEESFTARVTVSAGQKLAFNIADGLSEGLDSISGTVSSQIAGKLLGDGTTYQNIAKNVANVFLSTLIQEVLVSPLVKDFQKLLDEIFQVNKAGSGPSFLGTIFSGIAGLFGGGGLSVTDEINQFIPGLAKGGPIDGPAIVGERGPELFVPRTSGTIVPNEQLGGMGGTNIVFNITTPNAESFRSSRNKITSDLRSAIGG